MTLEKTNNNKYESLNVKNLRQMILKAKFKPSNVIGNVKISFSKRLTLSGIHTYYTNTSNTQFSIIPYRDPSSTYFLNSTKYNFTWTTTKLTEYFLEIQVNFTEPDWISK